MKKILFFLLTAGLLMACQSNSEQKQVDYEILSGQIKNSPVDKMSFRDIKNQKVAEITLDDEGYFSDTLRLPKAYYKLSLGKEYTRLYLQPGDSLQLNADYKDFDKTLSYKGKGAVINNYLAKKMLTGIALRPKISYKHTGTLNEKDFLKFTDSIYNVYDQLVATSGINDSDFVQMEKFKNKLYKNSLMSQYLAVKRFVLKDDSFKVSEDFPKAFKDVDINNPLFLQVPQTIDYLSNYISFKVGQKYNGVEVDPYLRLQAIDSLLSNPDVKALLAAKEAKYNISYTQNVEDFYRLADKMLNDPELKKKLKEKYDNLKATSPGTMSPDFTAYDINGKEYHLKDFAGKALYIDLWATWCSPCRAEIPHLEKLKEKYKGKAINFLSLNVYDNQEKWEKMVKENKMGGWQLINTDREMPFLKKYVVDGIPRFIFLDKEGKIIDANAPRPSEKKLIELLDRHID